MEKIYYVLKETKKDGTLILNKKKIDETQYDIEYKDDNMIMKPKPLEIKIEKIEDFDKNNTAEFRNSTILSCYIDEKRPLKNKYLSILKDIYNKINSGKTITKNTTLNFVTIEKNDKGFEYLENIGISIQHTDAGLTFNEILNQCIGAKIKLKIEIQLESGEIRKYSVN